jgi:hypothetical protein
MDSEEPNFDLIKFCHKDHNPLFGAKKMRIGTLHAFRELEYKEQADPWEGFAKYSMKFGAIKSDKEFIKTVFDFVNNPYSVLGELAPPGQFTVNVNTLSLNQTKDFNVISSDLRFTFSFPNSFIFCMTILKPTQDLTSPFSNYDSHWRVRSRNIEPFVKRIDQIIARMYWEGRFNLYHPRSKKIFKGHEFRQVHNCREVNYDKREISIDSIDAFKNIVPEKLWENPYSKPKEFEAEKEFRLMYYFADNREPLVTDNIPVFIPFHELRDLISA